MAGVCRFYLLIKNTTRMKKIKVRDDLMSKSDYSKKYGVNRVKIDKLIEDGKLHVERISGVDYIILRKGE